MAEEDLFKVLGAECPEHPHPSDEGKRNDWALVGNEHGSGQPTGGHQDAGKRDELVTGLEEPVPGKHHLHALVVGMGNRIQARGPEASTTLATHEIGHRLQVITVGALPDRLAINNADPVLVEGLSASRNLIVSEAYGRTRLAWANPT